MKYVATIYFDTELPDVVNLETWLTTAIERDGKVLVDDVHVEQCSEFTDQADAKNL